jgi:ketosteroid isomerase-like protein
MSESRNVELLKEYHGALQAGDAEKMAGMLAPDLRYWISPGSAFDAQVS